MNHAVPQVSGGGAPLPETWDVGALMLAVADALSARFNPVQVRGELSGFSRAASGHCYFSLKDTQGQVRCAMFRRVSASLGFVPRDGDRVEVRGKLDVYGPRGDLQLIVEGMRQAGQGDLFEQFMRLKARLQEQGLFDAARKKSVPAMPQSIGVVTSLGAAALRDVASTLTRRVPHIPITIFPASVQGAQAPDELCAALRQAFDVHARTGHPQVLLLVRGGGALEDLWAFNSEMLAHTLAQAPMPVVCGVGHETDFTIADFVADLRAPTPTAAAELCATDRETAMNLADRCGQRLSDAVLKKLDMQAQHLDRLAQYLARPSDRIAVQQRRLQQLEHALSHQSTLRMKREIQTVQMLAADYSSRFERHLQTRSVKLAHLESLLHSFDPRLVLQRGYAWLSNEAGQAVTGVHQTHSGQILRASLADGEVDLTVR